MFDNVNTMLLTCNLDFVLCGFPVWKHVYHLLHSCDRWYINPEKYTEPDFHEPGLNSLDIQSEKVLSREELFAYFRDVKSKIRAYLREMTDETLTEKPEGCQRSRLWLILAQIRHLCAHLGNINCTTIIETGKWPRMTPDKDGLYE